MKFYFYLFVLLFFLTSCQSSMLLSKYDLNKVKVNGKKSERSFPKSVFTYSDCEKTIIDSVFVRTTIDNIVSKSECRDSNISQPCITYCKTLSKSPNFSRIRVTHFVKKALKADSNKVDEQSYFDYTKILLGALALVLLLVLLALFIPKILTVLILLLVLVLVVSVLLIAASLL